MMTIKAMWFYLALAASVCGGFGAGYVAAPADDLRELKKARDQLEQFEMSCIQRLKREEAFKKGSYQNSRGKGF